MYDFGAWSLAVSVCVRSMLKPCTRDTRTFLKASLRILVMLGVVDKRCSPKQVVFSKLSVSTRIPNTLTV